MIRTLFLFLCVALVIVGCKTTESVRSNRSGGVVSLSQEELRAYEIAFLDGNKEKILGNIAEAEQYFKMALSINQNSDVAYFELAKISVERGRFDEAATLMEKARDLNKENMWYAEYLAKIYAETGQFNLSIETLEEIIEANPEKVEYYFNLGALLGAMEKYDEAIKVYDELENKYGLMEEVAMQRQVIYRDQNNPQKALEEVSRLITFNPSEIRYLGMKAEILEEMGRIEEAKTLYDKMLEIEPGFGQIYFSLFRIYENEGKTEQARAYLLSAFESPSLGIDVKVNVLLNLMTKPGESPELLFALSDKLVEAHPANAKAHAIQGDLYNNFQKPVEARASFLRALELDPNRPPIWQEVLIISSELNDFETMLSESEKAIEYFPQQPLFYLFNGIALQQMERAQEAVESLKAGKNLVIDNNELLGQFYASLGDAHHSIKDNKSSDSAYEKSLKYTPSNVIVLNNYAYYLSLREKDLEKAEKMAKKANDLSPNQASFQDTYAWVLFKRGNYQNALFWIKEALKNGGAEDPDVLEHHGDILWQLDQKMEAKTAWQMALDFGGNEKSLKEKIGRLE
ncbi:MAG: tetratricopeptide repeat protein [Flavobacteriales bacterium]|nr:tetratricopeptide repeat protein [Flavobacteriales bacterium]